MTKIEIIEGLSPDNAQKMRDAGITTTQVLLERGATAKGRREIENKTGLSARLILQWVNLADLLRIPGVGPKYAHLLEEAGVDTVNDLSLRNPDNLHEKLEDVNSDKKLVRKLPAKPQVQKWVYQARSQQASGMTGDPGTDNLP